MPGTGQLLSDTYWRPSQRRTGPRTASSQILISEIGSRVALDVAFRQRSAYATVA